MRSPEFPDPQTHDFPPLVLSGEYFYDGRDIISLGNELTVANVRESYGKGIFPWHTEGMPLPWFCPEHRAVLEFSDLHISRSLAKARRRTELTFLIDGDFDAVIRACSKAARPGQYGTWITPRFIDVYCELHREGTAHSVEAYDKSGELVGGLYGVDAGGVFCGESMFHTRSDTSKLALLFLIEHLKSRGATWLDIQVMTPHMKALGAKEISRREFLRRLRLEQQRGISLF
jgi:leucyl/phenylalanyl-tRNA--protein transferase